MRTLKELFIVLRDSKDIFVDSEVRGLCGFLHVLRSSEIITNDEYWMLDEYITTHRPRWYSRHYSRASKGSGYYWPKNHWPPRAKWINSQIRKLI